MGDGQSQGQGECATNSGERETLELMEISGDELLPKEGWRSVGEVGLFRISRPEEVIQ